MEAAASDARKWRAKAEEAESSRAATEVAAQQRAHQAVTEVARWRAEAEAAHAARGAEAPGDGGSGGRGYGTAAGYGAAAGGAAAYAQGYTAAVGAPTPIRLDMSAIAPLTPTPLPSVGPAAGNTTTLPAVPSAEAVTRQVLEQINLAAHQLRLAEESTRGTFGDVAASATAHHPPPTPWCTRTADGAAEGASRVAPSPGLFGTPAAAAGLGGGPTAGRVARSPGGSRPAANSPVLGSGSVGSAELASGGGSGVQLDAELQYIDAEIDQLQRALASAANSAQAAQAA